MPLVYVVEGNAETANNLQQVFNSFHHRTLVFPASEGVIASAEKRRPSIFLINVQLDTGSGLALCLRLRQHKVLSEIPIVLMSSQDSEDERVLGLELGADDFISTRSQPRELAARVNAVLRRTSVNRVLSTVQSGPVEVDVERFTLSVEGRRVNATATQVRLVQYLIRNEGRVFSRDQLLNAVWSDTRFITPRTIDVHVRRIREMIEPDPAKPRYLKTVRGAGYYFAPQENPLWKDPDAGRATKIPADISFAARLASSSERGRLRSA
jgi:DNA-binding response OmpR family regulator